MKDWSEVLNTISCREILYKFIMELQDAVDTSLPFKSILVHPTDRPWRFLFFCPNEIKLELKRGHKVKEMCDKKRVSSAEIKMHDFRRVKLSQLNAHIWYRIASLRGVRIVVLSEPRQTRPSAITTNANIPRLHHFNHILPPLLNCEHKALISGCVGFWATAVFFLIQFRNLYGWLPFFYFFFSEISYFIFLSSCHNYHLSFKSSFIFFFLNCMFFGLFCNFLYNFPYLNYAR